MGLGAQPGDVYVLRRQACGDQQVAVRRPQVQHQPVVDGGEPGLDTRRRMARLREGGDELRADGVATGPDRRADGGHQVARVGAELSRQRGHRVRGGVGGRAPPPGMHGADRTGAGVGQQDRHAIGRDDRHSQARACGDDGVGFRDGLGQGVDRDDTDRSAVHLAHPRQPIDLAPDRGCRR